MLGSVIPRQLEEAMICNLQDPVHTPASGLLCSVAGRDGSRKMSE